MRVFAGLTLLETPFALLALLLFWFLLKFLNIWVAAIICFVLLSVIMIVVSYKAMTWWKKRYPDKAEKMFVPLIRLAQIRQDYKKND